MTDKKEEPFLSGEEISQNQDPDTLRYRDKFDLQYSPRLWLVNTESHLLSNTEILKNIPEYLIGSDLAGDLTKPM